MNKHKKRLLVIDDDLKLCGLLSEYLTEQGFIVDTLPDYAYAEKYFKHKNIDLLILDRMLPSGDGVNFLVQLRNLRYEFPIILLTAKNEDIDRIMGLELGADDYVPKPFNPRELLARIQSILKRSQHTAHHRSLVESVKIGEFTLIPEQRILKSVKEEISLSTTEFAILTILINHARIALTRDRLLTLVHGDNQVAFDRSIDTQISRIRKIIEPNPQQPRYIQTVWGKGYMFVPDESDENAH